MQVKLERIGLFLMCLLLFSLSTLTQHQNNLIHLGIAVVLFVWIVGIWQPVSILEKMQLPLLFFAAMVLSTFLNHGIATRTVTAILTGLIYFLFFWICSVVGARFSPDTVLQMVWRMILAACLLTGVLVALTGTEGISRSSNIASYLIGNKFTVSYIHMFLLALFQTQDFPALNRRNRHIVFLLLWIYTLILCSVIDCATGSIGCFAVGVLSLLTQHREAFTRKLSSPAVFCASLVILSLLVLFGSAWLDNEVIAYLLDRLFNRSTTLTGRTETFQVAVSAILQKPIFGYGINSTYVEEALGWGNTQNGLLKMLLDYGLVGASLFLCVCWKAFTPVTRVPAEKSGKTDATPAAADAVPEKERALLAFLYGMVVCGTVEVCFSTFFFLALALLRMLKEAPHAASEDNAAADKEEHAI